MATSPNYGWLEPDNTDLVKNGALAIRTLGNAIDSTMATMTPKSLVDAKGDLIAATANDTPARLAVGNNGETLVADSSTATGLSYQANWAAGKNKIINGAFDIWQRGTSFSTDGYSADRWRFSKNASTTATISRQTFTPGAAPAAPYESQYFLRYQRTAGAFDDYLVQRVEDCRTLANTSSRFSFWAKASASTTISQVYAAQTTNGSGGGAAGNFSGLAITTSWVRYTVDVSLPSLSGATIGASSYVELVFKFGSGMGNITVDIWGAQWEQGSVATAFQTATGTIQGELAACQRYFTRIGGEIAYNFLANAYFDSTTTGFGMVNYSSMRTTPAATFTTASNYAALNVGTAVTACTAISADFYNTKSFRLNFTVGSARTAGQGLIMTSNNTTNGYIDISAEL